MLQLHNTLEKVWNISHVSLCNVLGNSGQGVRKQHSLKCMQSVRTYAGVRYNLMEKIALACEDHYRMGRFEKISHTCTDLLVAAVKVSRETIRGNVDVSPRLSALPSFVFTQKALPQFLTGLAT